MIDYRLSMIDNPWSTIDDGRSRIDEHTKIPLDPKWRHEIRPKATWQVLKSAARDQRGEGEGARRRCYAPDGMAWHGMACPNCCKCVPFFLRLEH